MKDYDESEVKARLEKAVEEMMKDFKPMFVGVENNPLSRMPEIYCRNCGRSVYVGRCCPTPDIQVIEYSPPDVMKEVDAVVAVDIVRQEGESFGSYFVRKVKARRQGVPPRGKEMTVDYAQKITLSPESFDKVQELCNNPPEPSQALTGLMTRKLKRD